VYGGDASDYTYIDSWTGMVLTDAEWTADQNGKLMLKLVRKGNNVYLIVGHTDESGTYSERLFKSWQGEQYAKAVDFGYVNTTNSSFTTPIKVSVNTNDVNALVGNKNLNIGITFNKYGTAQTDITSVKLNDTDYQLTEGKLVVSDLPMGFYTISAEGYAPHTLNLLSNDNIVMQYELIGTVKGGSVDQSHLTSDGYVTASSWGGATLKEAISGDFVYTVGLKSADNKVYGSLCFMDEGGNTMMSFGVEGNQTDKIYAYQAGDNALWAASFLSENKTYNLSTDEQTALGAGSLSVKLVKNGNNLYVFISQNGSDRYVDTFDITAHASKSVEFGLYNISGSSVNMALSIDITQAAVDAMVAKVTT
ncbi:MAG: hypothetical protein NC311_18735, partial [Muribaculaceae bacterium]|nr:hypothetical protein [Muribaculaceae bacterium]